MQKLCFSLITALFFLLLSHGVFAQSAARSRQADNSLRVREILVSGQRKIERDAILEKISLRPDSPFSPEAVRKDILTLFSTGYFKDIKVTREPVSGGLRLIYQVEEKPTIAEIVFEGNSEIKSEDLTENSNLKAFEILNLGKVKEAQNKLQKFYEEKGFFLARVAVSYTHL
ncbi:MAG: outer membrane protein assembly factor BamA, partial [Bdellovibrionaceae bacterium]|nr:outer membrane protein assembly factor BamA [Pseudobdellovibrionaceae bacterium]